MDFMEYPISKWFTGRITDVVPYEERLELYIEITSNELNTGNPLARIKNISFYANNNFHITNFHANFSMYLNQEAENPLDKYNGLLNKEFLFVYTPYPNSGTTISFQAAILVNRLLGEETEGGQ